MIDCHFSMSIFPD